MNDRDSDSEETSDDESSDDDVDDGVKVRQKRALHWRPSRPSTSSDCGWPPNPSNSERWPPWKVLRETKPRNSYFGPRMQLYSSTGWFLAIYSRNDVRGSRDDTDKFSFLELSYAGIPGHVRIQCMENNLFLAINKKGRLYGEKDKIEESTVFIESLQGSYNVYLSRHYAHLGWYVGLKKSGKYKKGPKTAIHQKACKFLPRRTLFQ